MQKSVLTLLAAVLFPLCLHAREFPLVETRDAYPAVDSLAGAEVTGFRARSLSDSIPEGRIRASANVADAIRLYGGIQLKDYGGIGGLKTVNVRGLGSEHTGVFMDGVQIGNAQNAQVDLGRFSTDDLEAILIATGHDGSSFRSAKELASGASVCLVSRRPDFSDGKSFHGRVRLRGGSFSTVSPYFRWEQKIGKKVSASASIEYLYSSGRYRFRCRKEGLTPDGGTVGYDTVMVRSNGDIRSLRAEINFFGKMEGGEWSAKAYCYGSERGLPGAVVRRPESLSAVSDRQEDRNLFVQGRLQKRVCDRYSFGLLWKYANDRLRYHNDIGQDPSAMPVDDSYLQHEVYMSLSHLVHLFQWWRLSLATDVQFNALDSDKRDFAYPRRTMFWGSACFAFWFRKLTAAAGATYMLAYDTYGMNDGGTSGDGQMRNEWSRTDEEQHLRNMISPYLSFRYVPFAQIGLTAEGFVKRTFRMPTFNDLYYVNYGNVSLSPEDAMQYDLRIGYDVSPAPGWSLSAKAEGYYNDVRDKIIAVPTSSQFRWTMYNIGRTRIAGAEGVFSWEYRSAPAGVSRSEKTSSTGKTDWDSWENESGKGGKPGIYGTQNIRDACFRAGMTVRYTFQRAADVSRPSSASYLGQIPYIPRHSGSLSAFVSWYGWRAEYSFVFTGERYSSSANLPSTWMQPWSTHDICLSKSIACGLTFRLAVNNILNRQYEIVPNYPMPRCNFFISIDYVF